MNVSIIGAGLSGLSCAFYLEKHGTKTVLYEKNKKVGDFYKIAEAMFHILTRPVVDQYKYIGQKYKLYLKPYQTINSSIIHTPNHQVEINGFHGFVNLRGDSEVSLEKQLLEKIKGNVIYNSKQTYRDIQQTSDFIVVATGDPKNVLDIQEWKTDVNVELMSATINGNFRGDQVRFWINHKYAPRGYAYMLPWNSKKASIAIGIPKQQIDLKDRWNKFLNDFPIPFSIEEEFDIHDYVIGTPRTNQVGNTLFVGNTGGFLLPFLGFGQYTSILSGLLAGKAIVEGKEYNELIKPLRKEYKRSLGLRRGFEKLTDSHFDMLGQLLESESAKNIMVNGQINIIKWLGAALTFGNK